MKVQAAKKSCSTILLIFLVASTLPLLLPQPAVAATKPSAPEFSVSYVDNSYYVAPVYGTDEFSGQTVIKQEGYTIDGKSVKLTMKNQPFTTYNDSDGNVIGLYFNFRYKGHYGTEWRYYPFSEGGGGTHRYGGLFPTTSEVPEIMQSNAAYTSKNLTLDFLFEVNAPSVGEQADFQVQALLGHIDYAGDGFFKFVGETSYWSSTQTVTIGESSSATTVTPAPTQYQSGYNQTVPSVTNSTDNPTPTQSGTQQNFMTAVDWQTIVIIGLTVAVTILVAVIMVLLRRNRSQKGGPIIA